MPQKIENIPTSNLGTAAVSVAGAQMLDTESLGWTKFPGASRSQFKLLNVHPTNGGTTMLLKVPGDVIVPMHLHLGAVEVFTISGTWSYQEGTLGAGGYAFEPSGVIHEPGSEGDVVMFVVTHGSSVYFDADGRPAFWLDAHMLYTAAKENGQAGHLAHYDQLMIERHAPNID